METLTPRQKKMARTLIEWAREHKDGSLDDLLVEEGQLARALGDAAWVRANTDDLNILAAFCNAKDYPLVPLLVVIPGLRKPEKTLMTHAFKATLSPAENAKRWDAALRAVKKAKVATWKAFEADVAEGE